MNNTSLINRVVCNGGKKTGELDLYIAHSKDPAIDGQAYAEAGWRVPGFPPLPREEALRRMELVEAAIREYYKDEFKVIREERDKLNGLSMEEMESYMDDPRLIDRLDAHYAMEEIDKYRQNHQPAEGRRPAPW